MSWIAENSLNWFHRLCINVLKCGPVPKHIAFIMDGNRRYATKENVQKVVGHTKGFDKLAETLQWCTEIGIKEVTVYAFSIENFKRSPEEVETLMQLAREKYIRLLEEKDKLKEKGVSIRVIGNLSLIPEDLRKTMSEAVLTTKDNKEAFVNVAFAYTSRDEIAHSLQTIVQGVRNEEIAVDDIDEHLVSQCMYSGRSLKPDMLIRTSGEVRFSDFLLWQIWNTHVIFKEVLWPDFSIWHLLGSVFMYQRCYKDLVAVEETRNVPSAPTQRVKTFLDNLDSSRLNQLKCYANA